MIGLVLVLAFIGVNAAGAAVLGRFEHGSFGAWWRS